MTNIPSGSAEKVLMQIRNEQGNFSASQALVASYVLDNYYNVPFMSITSLAHNIGVSDNTVIKFCNRLGYNKFTDFKQDLSNCARNELVMSKKLSQSDQDMISNTLLAKSLSDDISSIDMTLQDPINAESIEKLLPMIDKANRLYVTGGRSSAILAELFVTMLRYLGVKVYYLDSSSSSALDNLSIIEKDDLVIAISLPRYTTSVVRSIQLLHDHEIPVVLITDTGLSPALPLADLVLRCKVTSTYYFPCLAGCVSLISAICRALGASRKDKAAQHISELEQHLIDEDIFI